MHNSISITELPFGLLRLDATGAVRYYEPDNHLRSGLTGSTLVGLNFFTDVTPAQEKREFPERFRYFLTDRVPAHSFTLTFALEEGKVQSRILLTHIDEQAMSEKLVGVRIEKI